MNIIPGFVDPGDIREIKRILAIMGVSYIVFPDTTDVFDAPLTPESGGLYPPGGTTIPDLVDAGNSRATIALGRTAGAVGSCGPEGQVRHTCGHRPHAHRHPQYRCLCDERLQPHGRPHSAGDRVRARPAGGHDDRCSSSLPRQEPGHLRRSGHSHRPAQPGCGDGHESRLCPDRHAGQEVCRRGA